MTSTRLNKFIAHSAGLSRREADGAIAAGRVHVNNALALLGTQVKPTDVVVLDGTKMTARGSIRICSSTSQLATSVRAALRVTRQRYIRCCQISIMLSKLSDGSTAIAQGLSS